MYHKTKYYVSSTLYRSTAVSKKKNNDIHKHKNEPMALKLNQKYHNT